MKNVMMGFAACALLLSSCAKNEMLTNIVDNNIISFEKLNDRQAKAANDNSSNYGVYAIWSGGSEFYMADQEIQSNDTYTNPVYWPSAGTVDFYAYAPYKGTTGAPTVTATYSSSVELTYNNPTTVADQKDFTIATPVTGKTAVDATVSLSFNHMLSQIQLGTVSLSQDLITAGFILVHTAAKIKMIVPVTGGDVQMIGFDATLSNWSNLTTYKAEADKTNWHRYAASNFYIVPQSTTDILLQLQGITIQYKGADYYVGDILIKEIPAGAVTNGSSVLTDKANDTFVRGSKYTINFTLGADIKKPGTDPEDPTSEGEKIIKDAIKFSSTVVSWTEENMAA